MHEQPHPVFTIQPNINTFNMKRTNDLFQLDAKITKPN